MTLYMGVPVFGRDCRVALRAPRNDTRQRCLYALTGARNDGQAHGMTGVRRICGRFLDCARNDMGLRNRNERGKRVGVPLYGRDCRVALRAPRNDTRGVRAPRNDMPCFMSNAAVHSQQASCGAFATGFMWCIRNRLHVVHSQQASCGA
ncbi:MAG: hypothetical protein LBL66_05885, partial [Clostridiales bacterium]|nr:hypothetical protein [Clostridiales bacterium]